MDIKDSISINFDNICRTCSLEGEMKSLFDTVIFTEHSLHSLRIVDMLMAITTVQVSEEDNLPVNMCMPCLNKLLKAYLFKLQCEDVNLKLADFFYNFNKNEDVDESEKIENLLEDKTDNLSTIENIKVEENDIKNKPQVKKSRKKRVKNPNTVTPTTKYCNLCNKQISVYFYGKHLKLCHNKNLIDPAKRPKKKLCQICNRSYEPSYYRKHIRIHEGDKRYKCPHCGKCFGHKNVLVGHIKIHTGEKPYVCDICGKMFRKLWNLHVHKKKQHFGVDPLNPKTEVHQCSICNAEFSRKSALRRHMISHDNVVFPCDICSKKFFTSERLEIHRTKHLTGKPFYCLFCDETFETLEMKKNHEITHSDKIYLCNYCGKSFVRKYYFDIHLRTHTGETPYKCRFCRKPFKRTSTMKAHEMIHTGEKPYTCEYCHKKFRLINQLDNHRRTHTGSKPFVCSVCGKAFAMKVNLTVHFRIHSGETPFVCSYCDKGFYDSSSMKKHKRIHHSPNVTNCEKIEK